MNVVDHLRIMIRLYQKDLDELQNDEYMVAYYKGKIDALEALRYFIDKGSVG